MTVTVVDDRSVEFEGEVASLSQSSATLLNETMGGTLLRFRVRGTGFMRTNLSERRSS